MPQVETSIEIAAAPSAVWRVLTDFAAYPAWNPFITSIEGEPTLGAALTVHAKVGTGVTLPIPATIVTATNDTELAWRSPLMLAGLCDRDHVFLLTSSEGGCLLTQRQTFEGALASTAYAVSAGFVKQWLDESNAALKRRAEATTA